MSMNYREIVKLTFQVLLQEGIRSSFMPQWYTWRNQNRRVTKNVIVPVKFTRKVADLKKEIFL